MLPPFYTALPDRFWSHVAEPNENGCWLWTKTIDRHGYARYWATERKQYDLAHRRSAKDFHGPIPDNSQVLHHCDTPLCVNPKHLYFGTHQDNMRDMVRRGRQNKARGTKQHLAKLTESQVKRMRCLRESGATFKSLGLKFGVTKQNVYAVIQRRTWKHI